MTATTVTDDIRGGDIEIGTEANGLDLTVIDHPDFGRTIDLAPLGRADSYDEGVSHIRLDAQLVAQLVAVLTDEILAER
jgi:hypothetical protein